MGRKKKIRSLLKFSDVFEGERIAIDMYKELQFTEDFDKMFDETISGYILSGKLAALAEEKYENLKAELAEFRGALDMKERDEQWEKRSETAVKARIDSNPEFVRRSKRLTKQKRQYEILRYLNRAFQIKSELMRTKAADRRRELDDLGMSPPTVAKKKRRKK